MEKTDSHNELAQREVNLSAPKISKAYSMAVSSDTNELRISPRNRKNTGDSNVESSVGEKSAIERLNDFTFLRKTESNDGEKFDITKKPLFIGVTGGTASGKTSLCEM